MHKSIDPLFALLRLVDGKVDLCFRIDKNPRALWEAIIEEEFLGTGQTREMLRKLGWRAKKIEIHIPLLPEEK